MEMLKMVVTTGALLCVFDDGGRLVGVSPHPLAREPIGQGRETVYLERPAPPDARSVAA